MDADAEREKIAQEIRELERILDPSSSDISLVLSESSLDSDSDAGSLCGEDSDSPGPLVSEEERWGEAGNEEDPKDRTLPEDPETCLQLNMVYQEVVQEKIAEINLLLAQNREQQDEITWDLAGSKGPRAESRKSLPPYMYLGHFMKPYFKDRVTGVGPPANEDMREKAAQGVKSFEELLVTKWKSREKTLLRKSVMSDRLQRLLQPKLLKLEYLQQKQSRVSSDAERQLLAKQLREAEKEIEDIHQLPEEALLGDRLDSHDWEKISNVNFEGGRSAEEIRKFWQNWEHPSINKREWSGDEVERLKAISAQHGHLEWQKIAEELGTQRGAFQCLQQFQQHNTELKRREWTEEEDGMLTQLVREMRVGSHIPYRRIVYYMEGRDSMQLIYRWTKSLDPSLRKGYWAPEEDAKLLKAVAKHGAQDWFKIREEVPGRSDAQCRDRYVRRLHFSLKKGRWNPKEEEKLIELIEKYGAGHWAKIAAELPHRTGSQCLSKWKIMLGKKQSRQQKRRRPRRCVRWSSSSSGGEDNGDCNSSNRRNAAEREQGPRGADGGSSRAQYVVPGVHLWVPSRQHTAAPWNGGARGWPGRPPATRSPPKAAEASCVGSEEAPATASAPRVDASQASDQESGEENGAPLRRVPLETVLQLLRANTAARARELKGKLRQRPPSIPALGPSLERNPPRSRGRRPRHHRPRGAPQPRFLNRRLLTAVIPWVGDVVLPHEHGPRSPETAQTRADNIWRQLKNAHLSSTPVFTLLIQLFQIDTDGCMEVIRERKTQPPTALHSLQVPPSVQPCPGGSFPATQKAERRGTGHKGSRGPAPSRPKPPLPPAPSPVPSGPRPKPKTVSELLQEKRQREARARRTTLGARTLPVQLLVSPGAPLPALQQAPQGPPAAGQAVCNVVLPGLGAPTGVVPGTAGPWPGARNPAKERPCVLPAPAPTPAGARNSAPQASRSLVLGPACSKQSGLGRSQALQVSRKRGPPELPPLLPAAPSPAPLPAFSLVPAHVTASAPLPVTWVLTAPGLLPVSVPTVVGLPTPAGSPAPGLSGTLLLSLAEAPASQCGRASPTRMPPALHRVAETVEDLVPAARGSSSLGAARGARETAVPPPLPETSPQSPLLSSPAEAGQRQRTHQPLHSHSGLGSEPARTPRHPSGTEGEKSHSSQPAPKKGTLDMSLLSPEGTMDMQAWLRGQHGVCVPPLGSRLPYQPPTLSTLRALSNLLLHKEALEHKAATLMPGGATGVKQGCPAGALQAALQTVHTQLGENPAYLLLRARFLAAFSLPALLATLPPQGVSTTLSATTRSYAESDSEDLEEMEPPNREQLQPGPGQDSAPCCQSTLDGLRGHGTRQVCKRRRLS